MIFVVVGVVFLTLLEHSVLCYVHNRKDPNKVGFIGIFHPFRNVNKLFTREQGDRGGAVVKVLRYKSEGRWFDSRWCHWNFSLTIIPIALWLWGRLSL
jgi:hypothetical protein